MAKRALRTLKLVIQAGKATPAPPIGPALGQAKVNIAEFVNRFNEATKVMGKDLVPVDVLVYEDRSFDIIFRSPPASSLILGAIGSEKGSGKSAAQKIGTITRNQIREIAERKFKDLNAKDLDGAIRIIEGTARSMGVEVKG